MSTSSPSLLSNYLNSFREKKNYGLPPPDLLGTHQRPISCTEMHRNAGTNAENTGRYSFTAFRTARTSPIRFSRNSHPSLTASPLKKNFCTEFHDSRTIQSLSLRQRRTAERTRFTLGVHIFLLRKKLTLNVMSGCALSERHKLRSLLPSPQRHADWYVCTDVSVKRCRRLVWHMSSARSVEAVSLNP